MAKDGQDKALDGQKEAAETTKMRPKRAKGTPKRAKRRPKRAKRTRQKGQDEPLDASCNALLMMLALRCPKQPAKARTASCEGRQ